MAPFQSPGCTIGTLGIRGDSFPNAVLPRVETFGHPTGCLEALEDFALVLGKRAY